MANIIIGARYFVLTKEDYDFLSEVFPDTVNWFFNLPNSNAPDVYFALSDNVIGEGDYAAICAQIGSLSIGEAYFTTSVQANIFFNNP